MDDASNLETYPLSGYEWPMEFDGDGAILIKMLLVQPLGHP